MDTIPRAFFEKIFERPILFTAIKNAIKLLEISMKGDDFLTNYKSDKMAPTFEVLKLQQEYLYQTFNNTNTEKAGNLGEHQKNYRLHRHVTAEQLQNPYMYMQLVNVQARQQEMHEKLQCVTIEAIGNMNHFALKNPSFNRGTVQ